MSVAPVGAIVTLTYDLVRNPDWPDPVEGDWLVSYSERTDTYRTAYLIQSVRKVKSEANPRRFSLRCLKAGPADSTTIDGPGRIYPIVWYRRDKGRKR